MRTRDVMAVLCALAVACGGGSGGEAPVDPTAVTGTRIDTWWQDDGTALQLPALAAGTVVSALVPDGAGWREVVGTAGADGRFSIPGVGAGTWFLKVAEPGWPVLVYEQTARQVDLGRVQVGRPAMTFSQQESMLRFEVTGLEPWAAGGDLWLYSTGARLRMPTFDATTATGSTSGTYAFNFLGWGLPATGDTGWLVQMARRSGPGGSWSVAAGVAGIVAAQDLPDGGDVILGPVPLTRPATAATVPMDLRASDWLAPRQAVEGLRITPAVVVARVEASPREPGAWPGVTLLETRATVDVNLGHPGFPRFLPAWFGEYRRVLGVVDVAPVAGQGASNVTWQYHDELFEPVDGASEVARPGLLPVLDPMIAGRNALRPQAGVGLTPTLAWTAPALGTPTRYAVNVDDWSGVFPETRLRILCTGTTFTVPSGVLEAGRLYLAAIHAVREPGFDPARPERLTAPLESRVAVTALFSP